MGWYAVDDRFPDHAKVCELRLIPHFSDCMTTWLLIGLWARCDEKARETGLVPIAVIPAKTFGVGDWQLAMKELIRVGLWDEGPEGFIVLHDWDDWNGPDAKARRLEKRQEADRMRQRNRRSEGWSQGWSRDQDVTNLGQSSDQPVTRGKGYGLGVVLDSPKSVETSPSAKKPRHAKPVREDALRLCQHLADRIEGNGSKRPNITVRWLDAARLLMDLDGRTEDQIHKAIDWCQDDGFWKANVMSMPTLREKYDTLRLRAQEANEKKANPQGKPAPHHVDKGNPTSVEPPTHDPIAEKLRAKQSKEAAQ